MPVIRQAMGESRMQRKLPVRFGGGWVETDGHLPHGAALPPYAFQLAKITGADAYELERRLGHRSQRYIQRYTNPPEAVAAGYVEGL
jgi:hypothetical protein